MKKILLLALITVSVSLNIAFIGVWMSDYLLPRWQASETVSGNRSEQRTRKYGDSEKYKSLRKELGIDEEGWAKIREERRQMREKIGDLRQEIKADYKEMFQLLKQDTPDLEAVEALQDAIVEKQKQIQSLIIDRLLEEKEILSPKHKRVFFRAIKDCFGNGDKHRKSPRERNYSKSK